MDDRDNLDRRPELIIDPYEKSPQSNEIRSEESMRAYLILPYGTKMIISKEDC